MQHADAAGSDEQQPRCRVGRPRRGTALQQSQRRPSRGKRAASPAEAAASPSGTASRGRGRKRQRQQAPDPPPPPPEPQEEEQSQGGRASDDGATDDENAAGGSDSEAAALEEGAQAGAQPPGQAPVPAVPQLSTREQARRLLMRMGIPADRQALRMLYLTTVPNDRERRSGRRACSPCPNVAFCATALCRADLALDEAEEQAEGRGFEDPLAWAEQAQIVLACRVEFEGEPWDAPPGPRRLQHRRLAACSVCTAFHAGSGGAAERHCLRHAHLLARPLVPGVQRSGTSWRRPWTSRCRRSSSASRRGFRCTSDQTTRFGRRARGRAAAAAAGVRRGGCF